MIDLRYVKKLIEMLDGSSVDSVEISSDKGMKIRISKSPQHRGTVLEFVPLGLVLRDPTGDEYFVPAQSLLAGLRRRQAIKPEDASP